MPQNDLNDDLVLVPKTRKQAEEKSFMDRVIEGAGTVARTGAMATRLGSGFLSGAAASEPGIGTLIGGALGGGGEAIAEGIESLASGENKFSGKRIAAETGLGMIPLGSLVSKGRMVASAAKGGAMAGVGVAGRKWANGESMNPANWDAWDAGNVALGAGMGALGSTFGPEDHLSIDPRNHPEPAAPAAGPTTPPAAPRPDITKSRGLRVFVDKNIPPTAEEHGKLSKVLEKQAPTGEHYAVLGTKREDINPSKARLAAAEDEGVSVQEGLLKKEQAEIEREALMEEAKGNKAEADRLRQLALESGKASPATTRKIISDKKADTNQQGRNENAREKFVQRDQAQEAKNKNVRDLYLRKTQEQQAKNLNKRDKYVADQDKIAQKAADDAAAADEIAAAKGRLGEDLEVHENVTERHTVRDGNQTDSVVKRFVPKAPEGDEGGTGGAPSAPTSPTATPTTGVKVFPTQREANLTAKEAGAFSSVKNPDGPGFVHVFRGQPPTPPTAPAAPTVPGAGGVAVDDYAGIKAAAEAPIQPVTPESLSKTKNAPVQATPSTTGAPPPAKGHPQTHAPGMGSQILEENMNARYGEDSPLPGNGEAPPTAPPKAKGKKAAPTVKAGETMTPEELAARKAEEAANKPAGHNPEDSVRAFFGQAPKGKKAPVVAAKPELQRTAPSADIDDVNLATGVTKAKEVIVKSHGADQTVFKTHIQAVGAAKKAGLDATAVEKVPGGFKVGAPNVKNGTEVQRSYEAGGTAKPEGVVMENTKGKWDRKEFGKNTGPTDTPPETPPAAPLPKKKGPKGGGGQGGGGGLRVGSPKAPVEVPKAEVAAVPAEAPAVPVKVPKKGMAATVALSPEELDKLSHKDRFAYFKKQAPVNDATFPQRHNLDLPEEVKAEWAQLAADAPSLTRAEVYKRLYALKQRTSMLRAEADKAAGVPEVGSPRWGEDMHAAEEPERFAGMASRGQTQMGNNLRAAIQNGKLPAPAATKGEGGTTLGFGLGGGQGIKEMIERNPEFAARLGLGVVGAGVGANADDEHPMRGALIGGAIGAGVPSAAKFLNGRTTEGMEGSLKSIYRRLPQIQRFNLLTEPQGLGINSVAAPWGTGVIGSAENMLTGVLGGDREGFGNAANAMKEYFNFPKLAGRVPEAWEESKNLVGRNERGEMMTGEAEDAFGKVAALPGTMMTTGDLISRDIQMNEGGLTEDAARKLTQTAEPRTSTMRKFVNFARSGDMENPDVEDTAVIPKLMLPFVRTSANVIENSVERAPILGMFMNFDPGAERTLGMYLTSNKFAQQGLSGAVSLASYQMGLKMDPEFVKQHRINKLISNMAGSYGLVATAAFAAGQAAQQGKPAVKAAVTSAFGQLPLPTTQTPVDIVNSLINVAGGEPAHPQAGHLPQRWLPNSAVPGFLRDETIDTVEDAITGGDNDLFFVPRSR